MKSAANKVTRASLVSRLFGPLQAPEVGQLRYDLLRIRGRIAYLEPIVETGDRNARAELNSLMVQETILNNEMEKITQLRLKAAGRSRMLFPVL